MKSQLVLPFREVRTSQFREIGLIAEVSMWVCEDIRRQDDLDAYRRVRFRVDTGSTHSSMSLATAQALNLAVPQEAISTSIMTATGLQTGSMHDGISLAKFIGLEQYRFVWECIFHAGRPADVPPILGLNSIRPRFGPGIKFTFDGTRSASHTRGHLLIEVDSP